MCCTCSHLTRAPLSLFAREKKLGSQSFITKWEHHTIYLRSTLTIDDWRKCCRCARRLQLCLQRWQAMGGTLSVLVVRFGIATTHGRLSNAKCDSQLGQEQQTRNNLRLCSSNRAR